MILKPMDEAPKNGTHILIKGKGIDSDLISFYECWYWKPTTLHQWEAGARPHFEYVCNGTVFEIRDMIGWISLPQLALDIEEKLEVYKDTEQGDDK